MIKLDEGFDFSKDVAYAVQAVEDKLLCRLQRYNKEIECLNYRYGRPSEINKAIQEMSDGVASKRQKFPLIAVLEPYTIVYPSNGGYAFIDSVDLLIAMPSSDEWDSYTRQTENVDPILQPIYEELLLQIADSPAVVAPNIKKDLPHRRTVHKGGKFFNDLVDVIEIKGLQVKLRNHNC